VIRCTEVARRASPTARNCGVPMDFWFSYVCMRGISIELTDMSDMHGINVPGEPDADLGVGAKTKIYNLFS